MSSILDVLPVYKKKSAEEYSSSCPWCGGKDRFIVWPKQGKYGKFWCRQCNQKGDGIDILRKDGISYSEAKAKFDGGTEVNCRFFTSHHDKKIDDLETVPPLSKCWQNRAEEFVQFTISHSLPKDLNDWKDMLTRRHLEIATAKKFGLGWNPADIYDAPEKWGLFGKKIFLPRGLIIPIYEKDRICGIKVKCIPQRKGQKYMHIRGGKQAPISQGEKGKPVVIVESELDALLVWQEGNDLVSVIGLGGCNSNFSYKTFDFIDAAPAVYVATDYELDVNSDNYPGLEAFNKIKGQFPMAEYLPVAVGKDPCEMESLGVPVRSWLLFALQPKKNVLISPPNYPGNGEQLARELKTYPALIPCPIQRIPWHWINRTDCGSCKGHIHCLRDVSVR